MDDMTAFERQVAGEFVRRAGPVRPVDAAAVFVAITANRFPDRRFQTMFSATKLAVAGAIVALFGGFLLTGVLTQQPSDDQAPAAGASASTTTQPEPTTEASAESEPVPDATEVPQSDSNLGPGTFASTGSLDRGREAHTATLLSDGRVLVVGGSGGPDGTDYVTSVEAWDPVTGSFSPAGSLSEGRFAHTATLLADGRVLVVGGSDNAMGFTTGLASAEVWDPATESFSAASPLLQSRGRHTATLLADGRVLVVGGVVVENEVDRLLASAEIWDPATESFSPSGSLDGVRVVHTATLLPDGRVLIVGGLDPDSDSSLSAEIWDPATESFSPAGSLVQPRGWHSATLLPDGRVLIVGGRVGDERPSTEVWDPDTGSFSVVEALADGRHRHDATLLADGRVLVVRGQGPVPDIGSSEMELWDPLTDSLVSAASPIEERARYSLTALPDRRALLVGGRGANGVLASAEVWEPGERRPEADDVATTATSDLLPGVDLVGKKVEPGVYRLASDGVRDLVRLADQKDRYLEGILDGNVVAGLDGSVWWFDREGFFRLGQNAAHRWPKGLIEHFRPGLAAIEVGPDGTIWLTATTGVPGDARDSIASYDGDAWSERWRGAARKRWVLDVEVQQDGTVWMAWFTNRAKEGDATSGPVRAARLGDDDWEILPGSVEAGVPGHYGDVLLAEGGGSDAWLMSGLSGRLHRHHGEGWVVEETPEVGRVTRAAVGPEGTLWVRLKAGCDPETLVCSGPSDIVARFDGGDWEIYDASDGIPMMGDHYQGFEGFFSVAPDRSIWFNPNGDDALTGSECDGIANFDGEAVTHFLRDTCIYAMDLAPDGTVWLQAGVYRADDAGDSLGKARRGPIHTYVITPEAMTES